MNPSASSLVPQPTVPETATIHPPHTGNSDIAAAAAQANEQRALLCALSKTHGNIPNVPIFTQWKTRLECSNSAVHRSVMAGICGNHADGAFSIAVSGLYKDDDDKGDVITYTGAGGRKKWTDTDPPKRLRFGPQVLDQSWGHPSNRALIMSSLTKKPIRVIRSSKCQSQYAPTTGYRYDGLYTITDVWTSTGQNQKKICQCRLERLPNQPPLPIRPVTVSTSRRKRECLIAQAHSNNPPRISPSASGSTASEGFDEHDDSNPSGEGGPSFPLEEVTDVKPSLEPPQKRVLIQLGTLPRYRLDGKTKQLIRIHSPSLPRPETPSVVERAEGHHGEDGMTPQVVPSEEGHGCVETMPANERAETVYFSDKGNSEVPN